MALEDVRSELEAVKSGAHGFAAEVAEITAEDRYQTIPARAQRVAALATEMAALIEGVYSDANDCDARIKALFEVRRNELDAAAHRALEGSTDASGKSKIMASLTFLGSDLYLPHEIVRAGDSIEPPIGIDEAKKIAARASGWAEDMQRSQQGIGEVAPRGAAAVAAAIDAYIQNL